jgi:phage baseplate assembly protein V
MSLREHLDKDMTDAERRISNMVIIGRVVALDVENARVQVQVGEDITTTWLSFTTQRAGHDRTWHCPEEGEHVVIVCPCGDTNQGVIVGSLYRSAHPAPVQDADISRTVYKDGAVLEYDRKEHNYLLNIPADGNIKLSIGGTILELKEKSAVLTTEQFIVDAPKSEFTGHVRIVQGISVFNSGSGGTAEIIGSIKQRDGDFTQQNGSHVISGGDVIADGIGLKPHRHIEQGDGSPTGSALP